MAAFGWSAGDLVQAIDVVYKVSKELKDTGGASSDFQETTAFLHELRITLEKLQNIDQLFENVKDFATIQAHIDLGHSPVMEFTHKIELVFELSLRTQSDKGMRGFILSMHRKTQPVLKTTERAMAFREDLNTILFYPDSTRLADLVVSLEIIT
jgi:hypothetical protein